MINENWPMKLLEAKAIWTVLKGIESLPEKPSSIIVNSDCWELFKLLNHADIDLSEVKPFVDAILNLADSMGGISFEHCPREQNCVAHSIARESVGFTRHSFLCNSG